MIIQILPKLMLKLSPSILLLGSFAVASSYKLSAKTNVIGPYSVNLDITTSLPDGVILGAALRFSDAKGSDPAIGTRLYKVKVMSGRAKIKINEVDSTTTLPEGKYVTSVFYSPMFIENSRYVNKGIDEYISFDTEIYIKGDSISYKEILAARPLFNAAKSELMNMPLSLSKEEVISRFSKYGVAEKLKIKTKNSIADSLYYKKIDGTLIIYAPGEYSFSRGRINRPK